MSRQPCCTASKLMRSSGSSLGSFWQGTNNGAGFVARLLPDGTADKSFTDSGWAKSEMGSQDRITALKLQEDGALLVGGNVDISHPVVARFTLPS
ncbi:delta-60 repeat domain-containing protein [Pseudomonas viridiflava]|uniref:delta-60 repeat domain-containing protein n=1 Tax=Pseudomonas viridiflava TaxID=33069 RepID=UPI003B96CDCC